MKSSNTFPNSFDRRKQPHAFASNGVESAPFTYTAPDGNQPFHLEKMQMMKEQVMSRARTNNFKETNYCLGGSREMYMRNPKPQGSFNRPLSLSGSVAYGTHEMRGGFRTRKGQLMGIDLLQKRAKQLEMLQQASETGEILIPVTTKTQESDDPDQLATDLLISQIELAYSAGRLGDVTSAELRKFYALLKKVVLGLNSQEINFMVARLASILSNLESIVGDSYDEDIEDRLLKSTFAFTIIKKAYLLTRLAASTIGMTDKRRKVLFKEMEKQIRGNKGGLSPITDKEAYQKFRSDLEKMDERFDDMLEKVAQEPQPTEPIESTPTPQPTVRFEERQQQRDEVLQGDETDGQFAPGGQAVPTFIPEIGQYDPYGEDYDELM